MKIFLVTSSAPYMGTDQHYAAYAESSDEVYEHLYDNGWWENECQELYDSYAFRCEEGWEEEWEETSLNDREDFYDNDYDNYMNAKYDEWCEDCNLDVKEVENEEELDMYVPGGEGKLEIVYDGRKTS